MPTASSRCWSRTCVCRISTSSRSTAKGEGTYLKLKLEGNRFVVFQPLANGGNATDTITYNVAAADSKLRDNNDKGDTPTFSLAQLQADPALGNLIVKSLEITGGCAGSAIDGDGDGR